MDPRIEEAQELVTSLKTKCQVQREKQSQRREKENAARRANNNDEDFQSCYASGVADTMDKHRASSGRLSSNSAGHSNSESAFSSEGSSSSAASSSSEGEGEESETTCEDRSLESSSGRSSATHQSDDSHTVSPLPDETCHQHQHQQQQQQQQVTGNQLNAICNIAPDCIEAHDLIDQVRRRFLENASKTRGDFEQEDLDELTRDNIAIEREQALSFRLISRFINFRDLLESKDDDRETIIEKALTESTEKLRDLLIFRHQYRLAHVLDDHFCREMHLLHGIFPFGRDKNQLPVLYLRARVHRRWSRELDESFRRYVAWQVNLLTKSYTGATVTRTVGRNGIEKDGSFGICFDCLSVSYSCVDMDFLSFLVKILVNYYPTYCRYALCVDLPWLFRSVWKMVRSWLPEEARNTVHLITSKQLTEYIDESQIPNSIRVNDLKAHEKPDNLKHVKPINCELLKPIEEFAKDLSLSSSEVKQFRAHVEKIFKEYEQLGAM